MLVAILLTIYLVIGAIFTSLAEDSAPEFIKKYTIIKLVVWILLTSTWLPYLLVNGVIGGFIDVDIWFRKKND